MPTRAKAGGEGRGKARVNVNVAAADPRTATHAGDGQEAANRAVAQGGQPEDVDKQFKYKCTVCGSWGTDRKASFTRHQKSCFSGSGAARSDEVPAPAGGDGVDENNGKECGNGEPPAKKPRTPAKKPKMTYMHG